MPAGFATSAAAQSIDKLYEAAKKEGALSLNGGGPEGLYAPWVREFEQRFPGIKVKLTADFSNILAPKIDQELRDKKLSVDLTIFQTLKDYNRWKKQGVLMSFKPEGWDQIHPTFKDARTGNMLASRSMRSPMPTIPRRCHKAKCQNRHWISSSPNSRAR